MRNLAVLLSFLLLSTAVMAKDYRWQNRRGGQSYRMHSKSMEKINAAGMEMAYVDAGEGPVIVLTHGVPTNSWLYRKMIPGLVEKGYRVIAPDMIGFGNSEMTKDKKAFAAKTQAERLLVLMDELEIESWTHVVHDMSGTIGWELMELAPGRISELVLLNTFAYKKGFNPPVNLGPFFMAPVRWLYKKMIRGDKMFLVKMMMKTGLSRKAKKLVKDEAMLKGYHKPMTKGADVAVLDFLRGFKKMRKQFPRYQETLKKNAGLPTLVVWGGKDRILKAKKQIPQFKRDLKIKDENIHILKDAKHFIQEEKPEEIVKLMDEFLKKQQN